MWTRNFGRLRGITEASCQSGDRALAAVHPQAKTVEFPFAAQALRAGIRKKVMQHFSYNLFYAIEADTVVTVAVAHQRKRPNYWYLRLKLGRI